MIFITGSELRNKEQDCENSMQNENKGEPV